MVTYYVIKYTEELVQVPAGGGVGGMASNTTLTTASWLQLRLDKYLERNYGANHNYSRYKDIQTFIKNQDPLDRYKSHTIFEKMAKGKTQPGVSGLHPAGIGHSEKLMKGGKVFHLNFPPEMVRTATDGEIDFAVTEGKKAWGKSALYNAGVDPRDDPEKGTFDIILPGFWIKGVNTAKVQVIARDENTQAFGCLSIDANKNRRFVSVPFTFVEDVYSPTPLPHDEEFKYLSTRFPIGTLVQFTDLVSDSWQNPPISVRKSPDDPDPAILGHIQQGVVKKIIRNEQSGWWSLQVDDASDKFQILASYEIVKFEKSAEQYKDLIIGLLKERIAIAYLHIIIPNSPDFVHPNGSPKINEPVTLSQYQDGTTFVVLKDTYGNPLVAHNEMMDSLTNQTGEYQIYLTDQEEHPANTVALVKHGPYSVNINTLTFKDKIPNFDVFFPTPAVWRNWLGGVIQSVFGVKPVFDANAINVTISLPVGYYFYSYVVQNVHYVQEKLKFLSKNLDINDLSQVRLYHKLLVKTILQ